MRKKPEIYCVILNKCRTEKGMIADTLSVGLPHNNTVVKSIYLSADKTKIIIDFDDGTRMITAYTEMTDIFERVIQIKK